MAVVKDNAYGCGSVMISRLLEQNGVRFFAVARTCEARVLREAGVESPILVMGQALATDLTWGASGEHSFFVERSGRSCGLESARSDHTVPCRYRYRHGTARAFAGGNGQEPAIALDGRPNLICEGALTHFAKSDDPDAETTDLQLVRFRKAIDALAAHGLKPSIFHFANSAAIMRRVIPDCTMVRPGIALYGCKPDPGREFPLDLKPVLSLKGCVIKMKRVSAGAPSVMEERTSRDRTRRSPPSAWAMARGCPAGLGTRARS